MEERSEEVLEADGREEDGAGETRLSGARGETTGETPPPTPPPPVMPTPPMSTKKTKSRGESRSRARRNESEAVDGVPANGKEARRGKRRRKPRPLPLPGPGPALSYSLENESYEAYEGVDGNQVNTHSLDDTQDLQRAIEDLRRREGGAVHRRGSASNSRENSPRKRRSTSSHRKQRKQHHHPETDETVAEVNPAPAQATASLSDSEIEPPPEVLRHETSEGVSANGRQGEGDDDEVVICSSEPAFHKPPVSSRSPVKIRNSEKTQGNASDMVIEEILEPAPVQSLRRHSRNTGQQQADHVMALGVEKSVPIIERLMLPPSSESESEGEEVPPSGAVRASYSDPDLHASVSYASRVDVEICPPPPPGPPVQTHLPPRRLLPISPGAQPTPARDYRSDSAESLREIPVWQTQAGGGHPTASALEPHALTNPADIVYSYDVRNGGFSRSTLPAARKVSSKKKSKRTSSSSSFSKRKLPASPSSPQRELSNHGVSLVGQNCSLDQSGPRTQELQPGDNTMNQPGVASPCDVATNQSLEALPMETTLNSTLGATDVSMGTRTLPDNGTSLSNGVHRQDISNKRQDVPQLNLGELSATHSDTEVVVTHPTTHSSGKKKKKKLITKI